MTKIIPQGCLILLILFMTGILTSCEKNAEESFYETIPAISAVTQAPSKEKQTYSIKKEDPAENGSAICNPAEEAEDTIERMIDYGMQFLGVPYVYGGTSLETGLDCSSFTQQIFENSAGVSLKRTSYWQSKQGEEIPVSERKRGDLLFYAHQSSTINHVGIYLGDNQILHCSVTENGVAISAYNYCGEPVACRRYF